MEHLFNIVGIKDERFVFAHANFLKPKHVREFEAEHGRFDVIKRSTNSHQLTLEENAQMDKAWQALAHPSTLYIEQDFVQFEPISEGATARLSDRSIVEHWTVPYAYGTFIVDKAQSEE